MPLDPAYKAGLARHETGQLGHESYGDNKIYRLFNPARTGCDVYLSEHRAGDAEFSDCHEIHVTVPAAAWLFVFRHYHRLAFLFDDIHEEDRPGR